MCGILVAVSSDGSSLSQQLFARALALKRYCEDKGVICLCAPFSREASDRLGAMDVAGFKIGSGECNNIPLVRHVARKGRPMTLSSGMNDLESVKASVTADGARIWASRRPPQDRGQVRW